MVALVPLLLACLANTALGCTILAVGRKASADGSVILAHTDDAGGGASDLRLVRVPAMDHGQHDTRPVYATVKGYPRLVTHHRGPMYAPLKGQEVHTPLGHIPQVRHTYGYYEQNYGLVNEVGLAIAESSVSSRTVGWSSAFSYGYNMFDINELTKVALERCATARCAIRTMGDLAERYGFYSNYSGKPERPLYADSAEALGIADRTGEVWIFHMLTGEGNRSAIWAAQRVPDDQVAVVANGVTIREMDLHDKDNFMASSNVMSVARKHGWWDPKKGPFDFAAAYMVSDPIPLVPLYLGRRMWRIYSLLAPSLNLDPDLGYFAVPGRPTYPFSIKPEVKVTVRDVMRIWRDHYEGTPYDLTKGLAAGPFGNPVRYGIGATAARAKLPGGWERAIAMYRAIYSFIATVRPNAPPPMSAVMWYGQDASHGTVYVPFYGGQETVPPSYLEGKQSEFSLKSAYWAFNFVNSWSYNMYRLIHREIVQMQQVLEDKGFALQEELDRSAKTLRHSKLMPHVDKEQQKFAEHVVDTWWGFAFRLISKYNNGYICLNEEEFGMWTWGYPVEWLRAVGYDKWPGDTFRYPPNVTAQWDVALYRRLGTQQPAHEGPTVPGVAAQDQPHTGVAGDLFVLALGAIATLGFARVSGMAL